MLSKHGFYKIIDLNWHTKNKKRKRKRKMIRGKSSCKFLYGWILPIYIYIYMSKGKLLDTPRVP